jgi:hypothetical protein
MQTDNLPPPLSKKTKKISLEFYNKIIIFDLIGLTGRDFVWGSGKVGLKCEGKTTHFLFRIILKL